MKNSVLEGFDEARQCAPYDVTRAAEAAAADAGCVVVYPQPNQLQLDIDSEEAFQLYQKRRQDLLVYAPEVEIVDEVIAPSKSGGERRHITLTCSQTFDAWVRIGLQLALGSDPTREALSVLRLLGGDKAPSRLFERTPPAEAA